MSNVSVVKGSCLCGAVSLSTTSMNHHVAACHCSICRKWGGGPLLAVECESVSFEGEENIGVYQSSEWAERGFCNKCGSHLFYRLKPPKHLYYIPVGIFDKSEGLVFTHQVFIDEKPEYYSFANETKNLTGAEIFAQFVPPSEKS